MRQSRLLSLAILVVLTLIMFPMASSAQSNSENAHLCQDPGWETLQGMDGTTFANQGECVSHAAQGGTLQPVMIQGPVSITISNSLNYKLECDVKYTISGLIYGQEYTIVIASTTSTGDVYEETLSLYPDPYIGLVSFPFGTEVIGIVYDASGSELASRGPVGCSF